MAAPGHAHPSSSTVSRRRPPPGSEHRHRPDRRPWRRTRWGSQPHRTGREGAAGSLPPAASSPLPLVHSCAPSQGKARQIESNAKLSDHRELWARPDTVQKTRQNSSTQARRPGGRAPPELTVSVTSRVPSLGPFALHPSRLLQEGGAAAGAQAGAMPAPRRRHVGATPSVPSLLRAAATT